jgi:RNA polymerase sigma-70 factor (ECF subfamily)
VPDDQQQQREFIDLLMANQAIIHKVCLVYAHSLEEREDLFQEIVYQLWKSFPSFSGRSKFTTWMYRVALNTAITAVRKKSIRTVFADKSVENIAGDNSDDMSEEVTLLYKAIAKLDKLDRAIVLLWLEKLSYEEIADTVGITTKNVSVRLLRAKKKLAKMIQSQQ